MKKATTFIATAMLLACIMLAHVPAQEIHWYHVSPQGNNDNPGTQEHPFATIQKALDAPLPPGATYKWISLQKGIYFLTEPIRISSSVALSADQIDPYASQGRTPKVTISGGRRITGFKEVEKGLVVTDIPDVKAGKWNFCDLYVNDQRAVRARHPNTGYFRIEKSGEDRRTNFIYNDGDLKKWKDLDSTEFSGVELVFLHDWSITRCPIKEIDEKERRLTVPIRIGCDLDFFKIDGWEPHPRYFVENSIEFLDAPGEWFLDIKEGKLFYRLKEGESADTLEVIAPVLTQLLIVEGTPEQKTNIGIHGIRFSHAAYFPKPENTVWETQAAAFMSPGGQQSQFLPSPAAVHFEHVSHAHISNCWFDHLGENGLWFAKGCSNCYVNYSLFRDIGANGIMIGTHNHENTVERCGARNNLVEKTGETLFGAIGIWAGIVKNVTIEKNVIRQVPYGGISLGWQWNPDPTPARENRIANNKIYDCMQVLSDSGGIYTLGFQPDSVIEWNTIYGIPRASGRAESNGMFLDEGTKGFTIRCNIVYNTEQSSLRFHRADKNIVQNNILSNKEGVPMIRYNSTPEENIELIDNRDWNPDLPEFKEALERLP